MEKLKLVNILDVNDELKEKVRLWRNKKEIRKFMINQGIISKEEHLTWLKSLKSRTDYKAWVVFFKAIPIGLVNLSKINNHKQSAIVGIYIGENEYKGRGLGKCIRFQIMKIFFEEMKFKILYAAVLSCNFVNLRSMKNFKYLELKRIPFNNNIETIIFQLTLNEWLKWKEYFKNECIIKDRRYTNW